MFVTHLGHSCLLVEAADRRILLDPGGFSEGFEELRDLDAVVVTHQHPDHLDHDRLPALLERNPGVRLVAEPETAALLAGRGLDVSTLAPGAPIDLGELTLDPVGERHAIIHVDIPQIGNTGVVVRAAGEPTLYHPGDAISNDPGPVDILAVPINAPWCAMKETIEFVRRVGAPRFVPIHDGLVQPRGRAIYLTQIDNLTGPDIENVDLAGRGRTELRPA